MTNKNLLKILFVEDLPSDAELAVLELREDGLRFEHIRVDTRDEFIKALEEFKPDIVISDYMMPSYNGMLALIDAREFDPLMPFILFTGSMNEETAVECLKAGATDYIIKEHRTRLPFAVKEALEQHRIQIEKRAAELLLKETEEKLQSIFRAAPVGIGLVVNSIILEANDTFCTITGFPRKELIGKNFIMVFASGEKYNDAETEKYRQIAEKGTGSVETRFKCKDGRILNIFLSSTPLDKDDLMKGVTFTVMDITERKRAEETLRESEEKYRLLIDTANESIVVAQDGLLKFVNNITIELLEVSSEQELIGRPFPEFIHPDDRRMVVENYRRRIANEATQQRYAFRVVTRKGIVKWVELNAVLIEWQGKPATLNFLSDITERKRAEEVLKESESSLRDAQEIAKMGSWEWDLITQKTTWSDNYFAIHGFKPAEIEPSFELFRNRIHPDDVHLLDETHAIIMKDKTPSSFELRLTQPDGTVKWIQNNIFPVVEDDKLVKLKGVIIDITERKQAEEALKISEERFRTAAETLTDVVYDWDIKEKVDWYGDIDGIMGYPSGGFPRTIKGWAATIHPEDKERVMTALEGHLKGLSPYQIEYRVGRRDGEWQWWSARGNILRDNRGEPCKMIGSITDITERKRTEQELIEREARYKTLIENIPQKIFMKSRDYRWISVNENLARDFGLSPEEIVGKLDYDLFPRELADKYHVDDVRIIKTGKTEEFEEKYVAAGKETWIYTIKTPVRDMNGEIVGLLGIFWDITERRQAEDKLRGSEERLKILFDYAPDAYYLSDLKGNFIDGNIASQKLMGYNKNELTGKSFLKLNLLSLKQMPRAAKLLVKNTLGQATGPDEFVLNRKDGSKVTVEIITHPVKIKDKTLVLGIARDISERKRTEEALRESEVRYKTLFSNAAEGILVAKIETMQFLYANPALCKMFGYTEEEIIRLGVKDIHPKESLDYVMAEFEAQMRGEKILASDLPCLRKDGTLFCADVNATTMVLDGFKCNVGFFIDITDRKQAEMELHKYHEHLEELVNERTEELSEAKKEAEEANKAKSEFLANMSHEIRTPMNAVLGYTELLSSMLVDQTQKDYINSIKSSGRSLLTLINDILDLSKIEAGKLEMEYEYVDTYSFFSEFERIFSLKVSEKGLKFILDITSGTPAGINIDEARVRQIVFNLIGNAIKFTSEGKIVLKVFTENPQIVNYTKEKSEELIDLIIEVQDTGIGISKELQEAIFEPFVQERDNKHRGGTGLGLTITRRLTALMDGTIQVQSKPGKGSTFTVRIPEIAYLRDFSKTTVEIQIDPSEIVFEKASILIADDVEHNRSYLRDALKNTNLKIVEAEDGIAAYKLAKEIVPDLIIADIMMPKMDGFQLLDKIKTDKKLKYIPVIAYSASVLKGQKERIHNSEFAGLLIKPVRVTELYLELMNFLPYKSIKVAEPNKPLSEVDLIGEITNLHGLIHSLETGFYTTWETFAVRQPIGEIRDFGKSLIQLGMDHNSSIITDYGKELISAADSFNIEVVLKLIGKYKGIIESLKDSTKNLNND